MARPTFPAYPRTPRLDRDMVVTEKIDGTNALLHVIPAADLWDVHVPWILGKAGDLQLLAGSRTRYITPGSDNFGFAAWAADNAEELALELGVGRHYGEWWGKGIQRGYGLEGRRLSLFAVDRYPWLDWTSHDLVGTVPVLYRGPFDTSCVYEAADLLEHGGSRAAPGYGRPEGVVAYHTAARQVFKHLIDKDA